MSKVEKKVKDLAPEKLEKTTKVIKVKCYILLEFLLIPYSLILKLNLINR